MLWVHADIFVKINTVLNFWYRFIGDVLSGGGGGSSGVAGGTEASVDEEGGKGGSLEIFKVLTSLYSSTCLAKVCDYSVIIWLWAISDRLLYMIIIINIKNTHFFILYLQTWFSKK